MKKTVFLLTAAMAALLMASCSLDETREINKGRGIGFRISFDKTRATEVTTANLNDFWVTSFYSDKSGTGNFFEYAKFTKAGEHFESDPPYYWPEGKDLAFYAYSPSKDSLGGELTISKNGQTLVDYSPKADIGEQQDFIFAKATGSKTANERSGVSLTFNHALSQIEIKAKCADEAGWTIEVDSVKICEPVGKATFSFGTVGVDDDAWKIPETPEKTTYKISHTASRVKVEAIEKSLMAAADDNAMLIPQPLTAWNIQTDKPNDEKGAYLALKIKATNVGGGQFFPYAVAGGDTPPYGWVAVPIGTKWEAGKRYTYVLDFTNGLGVYPPDDPNPGDTVAKNPIFFTLEVTEWDEKHVDIPLAIEMVYVKGGTFQRGEPPLVGMPPSQKGGPHYSPPLGTFHEVSLSDYYIGRYEVTQGLWEAVMGTGIQAQFDSVKNNNQDPDIAGMLDIMALCGCGEGDSYPMYLVSWNDIQTFLSKLNSMTGKNYTLPTEAQWEFAARGGTKRKDYDASNASEWHRPGTPFYYCAGGNNADSVAWHMDNSLIDTDGDGTPDCPTTHPVGGKAPNELGIYDMSGNVGEWCSDWYDENYYKTCQDTGGVVPDPVGPDTGTERILRGGDAGSGPAYISGNRSNGHSSPDSRISHYYIFHGFRLVLKP